MDNLPLHVVLHPRRMSNITQNDDANIAFAILILLRLSRHFDHIHFPSPDQHSYFPKINKNSTLVNNLVAYYLLRRYPILRSFHHFPNQTNEFRD